MVAGLLTAVALLWSAAALAQDGHARHGAEPAAATAKAATRARAGLAIGVGVAPSGTLWAVGVDREGRLFIQTRDDRGQEWGAPRLLDIGNDKVSADGENRPKLAFGPDQHVVISYTQPLAKPYTGEIRMLRSVDGGVTFSTPQTVHQDRQMITHRFESLAFDAKGTLHTVWIDKRDQVLAAGTGYRGAAIYRNESRDGGKSFGPDLKLADHSCECCRIALAPTPDGGIAAMWRHVFAPNVRDHAFAILGATTPAPMRASFDEWKLNACPHHGPGLSPARDGGYHAVWFGEKAGRAAVRYGRLAADGSPQGTVRELPDPRAEHADVMATGATLAIVWRSFDGRQSRLRAWLSSDDGASFALRELAASEDENDHPRLIAAPDGIIALWRTAKEIHVFSVQP